ncbi:MAG: ATP-binding cassette domain-containing protein [Planctomycetes bacterium]|nr:ATP-binding cassette domain-containing protein [Planctomycetota bacterium]
MPEHPAPSDATVRWSGPMPPVKDQRRALSLASLFAGKSACVIGRGPECDISLPHPTVSRYHARLVQRSNGQLILEDLRSLNGVLINGRRIADAETVRENDRIGIGPFLLRLAGAEIQILDSSLSLRLEARGLEKVVPVAGGAKRAILDNISLAIEPGEFVSLLGPSGSGKSTLMDCLNGRRPATGGRVLANGENFYLHFDSFRQSLGYVPQRDIVHSQLPVERALYYTARLRLPTDTSPEELRNRFDDVIRLMELEPHRNTLIAQLSGGQIKRVSLGAELLARPCLLYIDEATSGLDAGTEARMMRLFRQLADEGKSVLCITHNVDNVDLCNLVVILMRGKLVFFGPPAEARTYFGVSRLSEVYDSLGAREPQEWETRFVTSSLHKEFVAKRLGSDFVPIPASTPTTSGDAGFATQRAPMAAVSSPPPSNRQHFPFWHQFKILTARYIELIFRDRGSLRLLFLQAPIIALFILCGFAGKSYEEKILVPRKLEENERQALADIRDELEPHLKKGGKAEQLLNMMVETKGPVLPEHIIVNPRFTYMLLFLIVIIVLWLGCNNAAKEIVKEEAIYSRERAVNLGIVPYLSSKFLILTAITAMQALLLMACIYGPLALSHLWLGSEFPYPDYRLPFMSEFGVLVVLGMTGVAMGLFLSSLVSSPDQANALLPYVLIPQIILGGGVLSVREGVLYYVATAFSPAYWGYRAVHRGATRLPPDVPVAMSYDDNVLLACLALAVQTAILLGLAAWFLRRKDVRRG